MANIGNVAVDQLRSYVERIEKLEIEKSEIASAIKDVFAELRGNGFDAPAVREVLKIRKMDTADRDEREHMLDLYLVALDMAPAFEKAA